MKPEMVLCLYFRKEYLAKVENGSEEDEDGDDADMINLGHDFLMFKELAGKLYSHQKEGILWLWGLHQKRKGGILADDMG